MFNVHVTTGQKFVGISAFISFTYNPDYVKLMQVQPTRYWHSDTKCWEVPYSNLSAVLDQITNSDYKIIVDKNVQKELDNNSDISIPTDYQFKTTPFNHQIDGINYGLNHKKFILGDEQGLGKALALNTKVYTPDGFKLIKDICVGDYVFNKYGNPVKVLAVFDHKNVNMYQFTFCDGVSIDCCEDHLWEVYIHGRKRVVDTKWFFQSGHLGNDRSKCITTNGYYKYYIDRCCPVKFNSQPVPLDPYVLGCLLGDGGLSSHRANITIVDDEIKNKIINRLPEGYKLHQLMSMKPIGYTIIKDESNHSKINGVAQILRDLNLQGTTSHTKFIPDCYKYNSVDVRLELVRGLIDTDGYTMKENCLFYTTVSDKLAEDMRFMVESLGFIVNVQYKPCGYNGKVTGNAYTLTIKGNDPSILCTLDKKHSRLQKRHFKPRRNIVKIEPIGKADARCITVDDSEGLYLIDHFIVTHNTKQIIDLACIRKKTDGYKHCLIISCVNGLKYNWQDEIEIHSNENGYILGTRINKRGKPYIGSNKDRLYDLEHLDMIKSYFIITNIETLRYNETQKVPCKTKTKNGTPRLKTITVFPIVEELQRLIHKKEISMIVVDEVHRCKDSTSLQGKALLSLDADSVVALTGTPLMNSAIDLYTPLRFIGQENHSLFAFKQHYCICGGFGGHQIVGYKNLPELQTILDRCMLRRLKKETLDLPDKIYINDFVEMTNSQSKIYTSILDDLRQNIDKVKISPNPLTMLIRLRQATGNPELLSSGAKGNPKYERMVELVQEVVDNGSKAIVFSNWTDVLNPAYEVLKKNGFKPALYTGQNKDEREAEKHRFKTSSDCKVICGTIGAMGTGLTLTEATTIIFLDEPWNRAIKDQAEDRAHRIGTTEHLNVITLMCRGTIDEKIHDIVYKKGKMSDIIVDKEEDLFHNPNVINYLLS